MQDKYDNLTADFSSINREIVETQEQIRNLEQEVSSETALAQSSKDKQKHAELAESASAQLKGKQSKLLKMEMEKKQTMEKMEQCGKDIEKRRLGPSGMEKAVEFVTPSSDKSSKPSKKSKK